LSASTQPADPAPTMMMSNCSMDSADLRRARCGRFGRAALSAIISRRASGGMGEMRPAVAYLYLEVAYSVWMPASRLLVQHRQTHCIRKRPGSCAKARVGLSMSQFDPIRKSTRTWLRCKPSHANAEREMENLQVSPRPSRRRTIAICREHPSV
jgi:hypothetical protein